MPSTALGNILGAHSDQLSLVVSFSSKYEEEPNEEMSPAHSGKTRDQSVLGSMCPHSCMPKGVCPHGWTVSTQAEVCLH